MACKFKYHINGVESKLYTELYGYMDNTNPEKKSVEKVYKIQKIMLFQQHQMVLDIYTLLTYLQT